MKNKIFLTTLILTILILSSISIMAFMPKFTHRVMFDESTKSNLGSKFYEDCIKHKDLCYSGNVLADVSVIFYYTQRGKYETTHNPSFCKKMLENVAKVSGKTSENMRSCAIGACLHQPSDIVSHSKIGSMDGMVSYAIKHSFIINQIIHVFAEQKLDNYVESLDPQLGKDSEALLNNFKECQDLFVLTMMGESAYNGMSKAELDSTFDTFITEVINSQQTGYNPGFENKSFFVTLKSVPTLILAIYIIIMGSFLLLSILLIIKIFKKRALKRHYIGLIIFLPLFLLMAYLFYGSLQGSAFNTFIGVIKPISNLVPTSDSQTWIDLGTKNTVDLLKNDEEWLRGTDASGLGTKPVLDEANAQVLMYDYIILGVLLLSLVWFIYFLFKTNKIKSPISLGGGL